MCTPSEPTGKRPRTHPPYTLLYHPGIPGRGEPIRLLLEAAGASYTDAANESAEGKSECYALIGGDSTGDEDGNPPPLAPPMLRVAGAGRGGKSLLISQSATILAYLGKELGFAGGDEVNALFVNELTLTALDLQSEAHDTHHPVDNTTYYEDQKAEALTKAKQFREGRIPKFVGYFERVLKGNERHGGEGKFLVGSQLSYADTTLWQVLNGLRFAFPKEMEAREKEFPTVFSTFYPAVEDRLKDYLGSSRRLKYSQGIFRYYPELDRQ